MSERELSIHPAFERFRIGDDGSARLLLIQAAARTGRSWFARSWIGSRSGEVLDWSDRAVIDATELRLLVSRLQQDADLHLAVILHPSVSTWHLASHAPSLVARHLDLLLLPGEFELIADGNGTPDEQNLQRIHELCGGWLGATQILMQNPKAHGHALQVIRSGLAVWVTHQDPESALSEVALLTEFNAPTIEAFFGEISDTVYTLGEVVEAGFLQPAEGDGWMMPEMVQQVLIERVSQPGPERVYFLEQAAARAMVATRGLVAAADSAVESRRWPTLLNLFVDHWVELFISNPRHLGKLMAKVPRFITEHTEHLQVALRMVGMAGKNGMDLQLPAFKPDYASDRTAQRLYRDTEKLYRKPNVRAVTVGLVEMFHLRLAGLFEEVGTAAIRLRAALHRALDTQRINSTLAAFAELQAGMSLQLAGQENRARQAYEMAYHWAQESGRSFLLADVAGKLALLNALEGDSVAAQHWLKAHESAISSVGWGKKMLTRSADLARASQAMSKLDFAGAQLALCELPTEPDNDEFWAVHAYLLALQKIQSGVPEVARNLLESLRRERPYAAASPLAVGLMDEALYLAAIFDNEIVISDIETGNASPAVVALGCLVSGQPDAALAALQEKPNSSKMRRRGNLAVYLELAARNPQEPTPEVIERVQRLHRDSGELMEIVLLMLVPGWGRLNELLDLNPKDRVLLDSIGVPTMKRSSNRPILTSREQEILQQLRAGLNRRQIAEAGYRSENTVKSQMRSLYRKLDASTLEEALENARALGL